MFKLDLEKAGEPEIKCQHLWDHRKSKRIAEKIYFCFTDYTKACVDHKKLSKVLNRWEYQMILPASWEICMQVKKHQLELNVKQQTGS